MLIRSFVNTVRRRFQLKPPHYPQALIPFRFLTRDIEGLGGLLSEVMRRLCVVRSEGDFPACCQSQLTNVKANPYKRVLGNRSL
jgi:hypothetical protein